MASRRQPESDREAAVEQLYRDYVIYGRAGGKLRSIRAYARRFSWLLVIRGIQLLKRAMDIGVSLCLLALLSPLFLLVAFIIRLQDGGPVLFWQTRVGLGGREFPFPKFRSMVVDAELKKLALLAENHHGDGITFKIKRDPRITWIGSIIRKLSNRRVASIVLCRARGHVSCRSTPPDSQ